MRIRRFIRRLRPRTAHPVGTCFACGGRNVRLDVLDMGTLRGYCGPDCWERFKRTWGV